MIPPRASTPFISHPIFLPLGYVKHSANADSISPSKSGLPKQSTPAHKRHLMGLKIKGFICIHGCDSTCSNPTLSPMVPPIFRALGIGRILHFASSQQKLGSYTHIVLSRTQHFSICSLLRLKARNQFVILPFLHCLCCYQTTSSQAKFNLASLIRHLDGASSCFRE